MKKLLILLITLPWTFCLVAQIDKERFDKIFEEEQSDPKYAKRESHSAAYQNTPPQKVPAWFVNPPVSNGNEVYAIGISDPEMDTTLALSMSIYRAQIMANVLFKSTTQLLCDFYLNEIDKTSDIVYEHFTRINSSMPLDGNFEIVESFKNNYDETVVLIKYYPKIDLPQDQVNSIKLELFRGEVNIANKVSFESTYELIVKSHSGANVDSMFYQLTDLGNRYDVLSTYENVKKTVPIYTLAYSGIPSNDSVQLCYFTHGLWKEYFKSVMSFIISKAREKPENISQLSDAYQRNTLEKLTRGISVNKMRFVVTGMSFSDNKLNVALQEMPLDE